MIPFLVEINEDVPAALVALLTAIPGFQEAEDLDVSDYTEREKLHMLISCSAEIICAVIAAIAEHDEKSAREGLDAVISDMRRQITERTGDH